MSKKKYQVTIHPEGQTVSVLEGTAIIEAAGQVGITLNTPCGGQGTCGKCKVIVQDDAPPPCATAKKLLQPEEIDAGMRLACQLHVDRNMAVTIPSETRFFEQIILTEGRNLTPHHHAPNVIKRFLNLEKPTTEDLRCDTDRILESLSNTGMKVWMDVPLMQKLPRLLRDSDFSITAILDGSEIVAIEPGDTSKKLLGVGLDIGTTTIAGVLVDLTTGAAKAVASRTNPQIQYGDDVVGRIKFAGDNEGGLEQLQRSVIGSINEIIDELTDSMDMGTEDIYELAAVGNTTMSHILLGINPSSIAEAPYVSVFRNAVNVKAVSVGINSNQNANLHLLPNIAGFVGSDTVALAMASRIEQARESVLAIDIGTNGELLIGNQNKLIACSCAAGPAFEGARIRQGMRGAKGAINKVVINSEIETGVIGDGPARGICGSGLLDAVAELLKIGLINPMGKILSGDDIPHSIPPAVRDAVTELNDQPAITLVKADEGENGKPILLTQKDVRELQLAKAAIAAAIRTVTKIFGIQAQALDSVLLAGGFGNFIRRSSAKRIGLLPDIPSSKIEFIGNAALAGARNALSCRCCRDLAQDLSDNIQYFELAGRADFQQFYMEEMVYPG